MGLELSIMVHHGPLLSFRWGGGHSPLDWIGTIDQLSQQAILEKVELLVMGTKDSLPIKVAAMKPQCHLTPLNGLVEGRVRQSEYNPITVILKMNWQQKDTMLLAMLGLILYPPSIVLLATFGIVIRTQKIATLNLLS